MGPSFACQVLLGLLFWSHLSVFATRQNSKVNDRRLQDTPASQDGNYSTDLQKRLRRGIFFQNLWRELLGRRNSTASDKGSPQDSFSDDADWSNYFWDVPTLQPPVIDQSDESFRGDVAAIKDDGPQSMGIGPTEDANSTGAIGQAGSDRNAQSGNSVLDVSNLKTQVKEVFQLPLDFPVEISLTPTNQHRRREITYSLTEPFGTFSSPGYPHPYTSGTNYTWNINVTKGKDIKLWFSDFSVGRRGEKGCLGSSRDYVVVTANSVANERWVLCGRDSRLITTRGYTAVVQLVSSLHQDRFNNTGFFAAYVELPIPSSSNIPEHTRKEAISEQEQMTSTSRMITFMTLESPVTDGFQGEVKLLDTNDGIEVTPSPFINSSSTTPTTDLNQRGSSTVPTSLTVPSDAPTGAEDATGADAPTNKEAPNSEDDAAIEDDATGEVTPTDAPIDDAPPTDEDAPVEKVTPVHEDATSEDDATGTEDATGADDAAGADDTSGEVAPPGKDAATDTDGSSGKDASTVPVTAAGLNQSVSSDTTGPIINTKDLTQNGSLDAATGPGLNISSNATGPSLKTKDVTLNGSSDAATGPGLNISSNTTGPSLKTKDLTVNGSSDAATGPGLNISSNATGPSLKTKDLTLNGSSDAATGPGLNISSNATGPIPKTKDLTLNGSSDAATGPDLNISSNAKGPIPKTKDLSLNDSSDAATGPGLNVSSNATGPMPNTKGLTVNGSSDAATGPGLNVSSNATGPMPNTKGLTVNGSSDAATGLTLNGSSDATNPTLNTTVLTLNSSSDAATGPGLSGSTDATGPTLNGSDTFTVPGPGLNVTGPTLNGSSVGSGFPGEAKVLDTNEVDGRVVSQTPGTRKHTSLSPVTVVTMDLLPKGQSTEYAPGGFRLYTMMFDLTLSDPDSVYGDENVRDIIIGSILAVMEASLKNSSFKGDYRDIHGLRLISKDSNVATLETAVVMMPSSTVSMKAIENVIERAMQSTSQWNTTAASAFAFQAASMRSSDLDECALGWHSCHHHADCVNTDGSYTCPCKKGYVMSNNATQQVCVEKETVDTDMWRKVTLIVSPIAVALLLCLVLLVVCMTRRRHYRYKEDYTMSGAGRLTPGSFIHNSQPRSRKEWQERGDGGDPEGTTAFTRV
ncbi:PREDICTED: mucin-17-like isoform X2 [Branchiostoma belcheri]|uniref:Mucin-17-like isoform X2 n=1 Tax=Branchiostoma belcheri TaxID=7741 RepID=A0A6P4Z2J1_BRABE|nr:PREDICTED: mucin-17-like isoform X2 [Branchiostoma belcheri]